MKPFLTLLFSLILFSASAHQARVLSAQIGDITLTNGSSCATMSYSDGPIPLYINLEQVSAYKGIADISMSARIIGGGRDTTITANVSQDLTKGELYKLLVGNVKCKNGVDYTFTFNAVICFSTNCDRNSNNRIEASMQLCAKPLPVELVSFNATPTVQDVRVKWVTAQEKNTSRFIVEASEDGRSFRQVGSVQAAGTSSTQRVYTYNANRVSSVTYFRLKSVDNDATFSYSSVVAVTPLLQGREYLTGTAGRYVAFQLATGEVPTKVSILDTSGRVLFEQAYDQEVNFNVTDRLVILRLVTNTGSQYSKLFR